MKIYKILTIILFFGSLLSCTSNNEPESLFDESPEARIDAVINDYKTILQAPQHGWMGYYSSNNDMGGYLLLLDFDESMVKIKSEALDFINRPVTEETVSYKVGVKQRPEVVFESHSTFHAWHDAMVNRQLLGGGEFEFSFEKITESEIILKSKTDLRDITYLVLKPAREVDWNFDGLPAMQRKLFGVSPSRVYINQKLTGGSFSKFVEMDITKRLLHLEEEDGKVASHRFGVTRRGIVMLDTLVLNGERITEFLYKDAENTIVSDSPSKLKIETLPNAEKRYLKPTFSDELFAQAPKAFVTKTWVYAKSPELKTVLDLTIQLKDYPNYIGLELLTNLRTFQLFGAFVVEPVIDFSNNKELRKIVMMINKSLKTVTIENLPNLQEVVISGNEKLTSINLSQGLPNLKEVYAHVNNIHDFSMNLKGAPNLLRVKAENNGWKSLDVTGCSSLEELLVKSGNSYEGESDDYSVPTMPDIQGLSAQEMPNLVKLYVPISAKCGANVLKFYWDTKKEGRQVQMIYGNSLLEPDKGPIDPKYYYNDHTCE